MTLAYAREVLNAEIRAIELVRDRMGATFEEAIDRIMALRESGGGHVVTCGMGKAGLIAKKVSATLASCGTPSFYLHPADALHGDLGMVRAGDVCLILSNSGESDEITHLLPCLRRLGPTLIAVTGNDRSTLAAHADILLPLGHIEEACPLGLAPTATTTAMLALGDALAMCLMRRSGFAVQDYAHVHPGGQLGRRALPIGEVMRVGEAVAHVPPHTSVGETILRMTAARSGAAVVVDEADRVLGIFCDGDLRRGLEREPDILRQPVGSFMTVSCTTVPRDMVAGDVLVLMREKRIAEIPVLAEDGTLAGVADMKGLVSSL